MYVFYHTFSFFALNSHVFYECYTFIVSLHIPMPFPMQGLIVFTRCTESIFPLNIVYSYSYNFNASVCRTKRSESFLILIRWYIWNIAIGKGIETKREIQNIMSERIVARISEMCIFVSQSIDATSFVRRWFVWDC